MPTMRKLRQVLSNFYPIDTGSVLEFMCPAAGFVDRPAHLALEAVPRTPEAARKRYPQTFDCAFGKEGLHVGKDLFVDDIFAVILLLRQTRRLSVDRKHPP